MERVVVPSELLCRDLTVQFSPGKAVLNQVQTTIPAGKITSLIGASGCGKTTLLRVLAGLQQPSSGSVQISPPVRAGSGELAYVFQQPTLLPWRSATENVSLALELTKSAASAAAARRLAEQQLQQMELPAESWQRFPRQLSGGMMMRVSLARALVTQPKVLLMDEPFAALDDLSRSALGELLWRRWRQRAFTAVLVTHNIAEAVLLSHQIQVMAGGQIQQVIDNPLPDERTRDLRTTAEFGRLFLQVSNAIWGSAAAGAESAVGVAGDQLATDGRPADSWGDPS